MNTRRWLHLVFFAVFFAFSAVCFVQMWEGWEWPVGYTMNFVAFSVCITTMPPRASGIESVLYLIARRAFGKSRRESRAFVADVMAERRPAPYLQFAVRGLQI